ncbi:rhodanese-like domain-containing protein [Gracilibacillus caseinilyticus]|uniref:Rhodanese-like domain-containing protein n=1 Tax=Gracilibacillus caseinilyticus TaxID=2932256 RepID=A0ABY4ESS2_9BACI|nr:rhodanese-like domain-containing protein [Gracilibacillus caseinilyticus]UOQ47469.1 rhodanese-like domain-containing protein [Gracilibacillus caseinilyticus]
MTQLYILLAILAAFILFSVYRYFKQKRILKALSENDFREGYRKAQLIDVREPKEFDGGHILGARNIPLTQLKQRLTELRKDKPVYLYCQSGSRSMRAALILDKQGYKDLYQLQGGYKKWTGKIKKTKK